MDQIPHALERLIRRLVVEEEAMQEVLGERPGIALLVGLKVVDRSDEIAARG